MPNKSRTRPTAETAPATPSPDTAPMVLPDDPSVQPPRFIMLGGFLGAGKTTTVLRLAHFLQRKGKRVGLITNDQAAGLVDTALAEELDLPVSEIAGGCFCCRSESLVDALNRLENEKKPEIFIAEPVGSCTDLVATVSLPLTQIYGKKFIMAPYTVLVDPFRAESVLEIDGDDNVPGALENQVTDAPGLGVLSPAQENLEARAPGALAIMAEMEEVIAGITMRAMNKKRKKEGKNRKNASAGKLGFSSDVNYIYRKQLEEAEVIVINKMDVMAAPRREVLKRALQKAFPQAAILEISSRSGRNMDPLLETLTTQTATDRQTMEVDYERYGRGEAMLGWCNGRYAMKAPMGIDGNEWVKSLVESIRDDFSEKGLEIAHLKATLEESSAGVTLEAETMAAVQIVRTDGPVEFTRRMDMAFSEGELLINLRAEAAPAVLLKTVKAALKGSTGKAHGVTATEVELQHFRPGQPVPVHRITSAGS